jgi:hypothetical protein
VKLDVRLRQHVHGCGLREGQVCKSRDSCSDLTVAAVHMLVAEVCAWLQSRVAMRAPVVAGV